MLEALQLFVVCAVLVTRGPSACLVMYMAAPLVTIVHEFSHAGAAYVIGRPPRLVWVFAGRRRWSFAAGSLVLSIGSNPLGGGFMMHVPTSRRRHNVAILLAGPGSGFVIGLAAVVVELCTTGTGARAPWLVGLAAASLSSGIYSLLPLHVRTAVGRRPTDGLQILRLIRSRSRDASPALAVTDDDHHLRASTLALDLYVASVTCRTEGVPALIERARAAGNADAMIAAAGILAEDRHAEACELALRALELEPTADTRAFGHAIVAWCLLLDGSEALLDEAHDRARDAALAAPSVLARAILGWAMLRLGRIDEAHGALAAAWSEGTDDRATLFILASALAHVANSRGDRTLEMAWHRVAGRAIGHQQPPALPAIQLTTPPSIEPPQGRPLRAPLDRQVVDSMLKVGGTDWWLWLTLSVLLTSVPAIAAISRNAPAAVMCTTPAALSMVAAVRGFRRQRADG